MRAETDQGSQAKTEDWHRRRILIVAPVGRSADVLVRALSGSEFESQVLADVDELCRELPAGAGAVILLQEALSNDADLRMLAEELLRQPAWSDVAVHVLVRNNRRTEWYLARLSEAGYDRAIVLPRPLSRASLLSLLEAAIRSRTRQYVMHALIEALGQEKALIEGRNAELNEQTAMIAHDIRSPLHTISLALKILETADGKGQDGAQVIGRAQKAVAHATEFSSDLLHFIQAGKQADSPPPRDVTDLNALMDEIAGTSADAGFVTHDPLPSALGSRELLLRVLQNLVSNGLKYSHAERPHVHVSAVREDEWVRVDVRDNGLGISDEDRERIFEPFQRSRADEFAGTGVGLASCQQIVSRLGGRLWIDESSEDGTVFSFTVPATAGGGE